MVEMRWLLAVLAIAGCYSPDLPTGSPCVSGVCPDGLVCSPATQTCERTAIDARVADGSVDALRPDAALDAPPDAAAATATLIQQNTAYGAAPTASLSVTLATTPTAGHVLVMVGATPQASLATVTGGGVTTWTQIAASTVNANIEVWYGVSDGSSSTVTIGLPGGTAPMGMAVTEWAGLATTNTLDVKVVANGLTSPANAGALTTTGAPRLLLFAVGNITPNTFGTPGPAMWNALMGPSGAIQQRTWYRVTNITSVYVPSVSETGHAWDAALVALRIAP